MAKKNDSGWPKPSDKMVKILDEHASRFPSERRKMFGHPCYFVNGNMFAGVFSEGLFARFSPEDRELLAKGREGVVFEPVEGRTMKEYLVLSSSVVEDAQRLDHWLERSHSYVTGLRSKR